MSPVVLPKHLNITMTSQIQEMLQQALDLGQAVTLDAQAIEKVDTTGIQLLYGFCCSLEAGHQELHWENIPDVLMQTAKHVGMQRHILLEL